MKTTIELKAKPVTTSLNFRKWQGESLKDVAESDGKHNGPSAKRGNTKLRFGLPGNAVHKKRSN